MKSTNHLDQYKFKKGQSGNPGGRPIDSITHLIKKKLAEVMPYENNRERKRYIDAILEKIMANAIIEGDAQTIKMIWNYIDGMPDQRHKVEGADGGPVKIEIEYVNPEIQNKPDDSTA